MSGLPEDFSAGFSSPAFISNKNEDRYLRLREIELAIGLFQSLSEDIGVRNLETLKSCLEIIKGEIK